MLEVIDIDGNGEIDYLGLLTSEYFSPRFPEVLLGYDNVLEVLDWIVEEEIPSRRRAVVERAKANPGERPRPARDLYTASVAEGEVDPFPPLIVVVDEFAEIMLAGRQVAQRFEQRVQQVVQTGRSTLVHVVLATQRPDTSVVRGAIKTNIPARIALRLPTHHDSSTVLGRKGAEQLLGLGDLIYQGSDQPPVRLQGYSV